jgi:hypothetical protein
MNSIAITVTGRLGDDPRPFAGQRAWGFTFTRREVRPCDPPMVTAKGRDGEPPGVAGPPPFGPVSLSRPAAPRAAPISGPKKRKTM